jgi:Domain of unknown function (DUF4394)
MPDTSVIAAPVTAVCREHPSSGAIAQLVACNGQPALALAAGQSVFRRWARFGVTAALVAGCGALGAAPSRAATSMTALGVGANANQIFSFQVGSPNVVTNIPVSGLGAYTLVGIDHRPLTGELFGLGVNGNSAAIFTVAPATGSATLVGSATVSSIAGATSFGVDFNPVTDRIRVVNNLASDGAGGNANNFRLNPSGALAGVDTDGIFTGLPGGNANAPTVAVAYDRNVGGASATTLFGIVSGGDRLVMQGGVDGNPSPNLGVLSNVGLLTVDTSNNAGFDIDPASGEGYAVLEVGGTSRLYRINLATGQATEAATDSWVGDGTADFGGLAIDPPAAPQPPSPQAPAPQTPPVRVQSLRVKPKSFAPANIGGSVLISKARRARVGTTVRYRISAAVSTSFTVERTRKGRKVGKRCKRATRKNRGRKSCTRVTKVKGSFSHSGAAGLNRFKFTGRVSNKALRRGTYRLVARAGTTVKRAKFKIVR